MDANTLRLILLIIGVILILALYLWERSRDDGEEDFDLDEFDDHEAPEARPRGAKREPNLGQLEAEDDPRGTPVIMTENAPEPLLVQLSVSARARRFRGPDLMRIAETCGLHPGEMDIFHCQESFGAETRVYFSMANMVKPGSFAFDAMDTFSTPGVVLFAQLEGDPEDMNTLDELLATARKIATALDGEVLDEQRKPLTVKKEETLRRSVLAHEMRWTRAVLR